ncbi:MAG: aminopeptidase P N-terminal domain-containing protein [Cytophagales bacterium]|nr:aminopeptidase P N-terminal domain-containing protein [Cytophagales bacterium]
MRYTPANKNLYIENRKKFSSHLLPDSIAIFNSNDIMPSSADGVMPFVQQTDLFYLSGIDQEESLLLIFPGADEKHHREILFLKETSEEIAIWEGHKYTKEEAKGLSGIKSVYWLSQFKEIFNTLVVRAENIYLNSNEHLRAKNEVETRDTRFAKWCRENYRLHNYERSQPILHRIRTVKSKYEIEQIKEAIRITELGFRRVLKFIKPDVTEYQIEAELIHEFISNRSRRFAFQPIIASGLNACVLHYVENKDRCKNGDLVLMDIGAEYGNYNADLTRCVPVNGRFTKRQKSIYNAVLRVQREAMSMLRPGNKIPEYHKEVGKIMESELIGLGLLSKTDIKNQDPARPAYKNYFMHGTSHHLGLDVHDYGYPQMEMAEGMVFTVEPGIYIREEKIGIRLENDVVIRKTHTEDLMKNIPIEADEIENIMHA